MSAAGGAQVGRAGGVQHSGATASRADSRAPAIVSASAAGGVGEPPPRLGTAATSCADWVSGPRRRHRRRAAATG